MTAPRVLHCLVLHCLCCRVGRDNIVRGTRNLFHAENEEQIFAALGLEYVDPTMRNTDITEIGRTQIGGPAAGPAGPAGGGGGLEGAARKQCSEYDEDEGGSSDEEFEHQDEESTPPRPMLLT